MQLGAALVTILDGVIVKGAVMLLCGWLLVSLWLALRPKPGRPTRLVLSGEDAREARVLVASLALFAASELACTIDALLLGESRVMDGVHSVVSALGTGLFALWLVLFLDRKIVRFGEAGCVMGRVCRGCTFANAERCKALNTATLVAVLIAALGAVILAVPTEPVAPDAQRYALPASSLNAWYDGSALPWLRSRAPGIEPSGYPLPTSTLIIEMRLVPLSAAAIAAASIVLLRTRREQLGLRVLGFGAGMLAYSGLELALFAATRDAILGSLGHELAELWFVVVTWEILRRGFARSRRQLVE